MFCPRAGTWRWRIRRRPRQDCRRSVGRPRGCRAHPPLAAGHADQCLVLHQRRRGAGDRNVGGARQAGLCRTHCPLLAGIRGQRQGAHHARSGDVASGRAEWSCRADGRSRNVRVDVVCRRACGHVAAMGAWQPLHLSRPDLWPPCRRSAAPRRRAKHRPLHRGRDRRPARSRLSCRSAGPRGFQGRRDDRGSQDFPTQATIRRRVHWPPTTASGAPPRCRAAMASRRRMPWHVSTA